MNKARKKLQKTASKPAKRLKPRRAKKNFITQAEARRRAERHVLNRLFKGATVRDGKTARWCAYDPTSKLAGRETWLVYRNAENPSELKSASIIAVCKRTGRVLYEGSAHDEG